MLKYAVYPGPVRSRVDGDIHNITAPQLMRLYLVNPSECLVIVLNDPEVDRKVALVEEFGLIPLVPLYEGNYPMHTGIPV